MSSEKAKVKSEKGALTFGGVEAGEWVPAPYEEPLFESEYRGVGELLPCPFCGNKPQVKVCHFANFRFKYFVCCENLNCPMICETTKQSTSMAAVSIWNNRIRPVNSKAPKTDDFGGRV